MPSYGEKAVQGRHGARRDYVKRTPDAFDLRTMDAEAVRQTEGNRRLTEELGSQAARFDQSDRTFREQSNDESG